MKTFNLVQFIETLLIPDLQKMADQQLHYYAFSVICQGVEIMGAALDDEQFDKVGLSEQRFKNGLTHFFNNDRYRQNQTKFFTLLRGPLIHQLRPGDGFFLASEAKDKIESKHHLEKHESGATILIIEPFLKDFIQAFEKFKKNVADKKAAFPQRFSDTFIAVSSLNLEYGKKTWDPNLSNTLTLTPFVTGSAMLKSKFPESTAD